MIEKDRADLIQILIKPGVGNEEYSELLPEYINMYLMSKIFPWCSPNEYRKLSDFDRMVYLSILDGEGQVRKDKNDNNSNSKKQGIGKKRGVRK